MAHAPPTLRLLTSTRAFSLNLPCAAVGALSSREDLADGWTHNHVRKIGFYVLFTLFFKGQDFAFSHPCDLFVILFSEILSLFDGGPT